MVQTDQIYYLLLFNGFVIPSFYDYFVLAIGYINGDELHVPWETWFPYIVKYRVRGTYSLFFDPVQMETFFM